MFKIYSVEIKGFWGRGEAKCDFDNDVNIIIGKNGTGKTTFMNILKSVLEVDVKGLLDNDFSSIVIKLSKESKVRTITVKITERKDYPYVYVEYKISRKKYFFKVIDLDDKRIKISRFKNEEYNELKSVMKSIVCISSISVYRFRHGNNYEIRKDNVDLIVSPVDYRLNELISNLTQYKLELSMQAQEVSNQLQKEVLASILFSEKDGIEKYKLEYKGKEREKQDIIDAYKQLHAYDNVVDDKIKFHVESIDRILRKYTKEKRESIDFMSLEAFRKTKNIIKLSLEAKEKTRLINSQISLFTDSLMSFIEDKKFYFDSNGRLSVKGPYGDIECEKLSSGEKQLIILFIEALLQRKSPHIFLTDEPELSLHISWQKKILPAIFNLNPNAQIIAATHSPEVASEYPLKIRKMKDIAHA